MNFTFEAPYYAAASWNGTEKTFSWGSGGNNSDWTFININNVSGDISKYTKLYFKLENWTNSAEEKLTLYFKENKGNRQSMDYVAKVEIVPNGEGEFEFDLTTFDWKNNANPSETIDKTNIYDVTLYGGARTSEEEVGSVKITEAYLEKPDPLTRTVYALGSPITFADALASSEPFVLVQNDKVFCVSGGDITYKDVSEISDCAWKIVFEEDAEKTGNYYMHIYDNSDNSKGYVNASVWSHTWLSGVDKNGTKGERQDGALWTVEELPNGKYTIRNLGDTEGSYGDEHISQGYLAITTNGYWANHVTHYNTSGEWEFYSLGTTELPANDHLYYGWNAFTVDGGATGDDEKHLVVDTRGYAPYWATSGTWKFDTPLDASGYRYLVFYAKRNITKYGNDDNETGGSLLIKDDNGVTMRQDDYTKYNDVNYPDVPSGNFWMNRWGAQRAMVLDLQWLANKNKYGDGSECKSIDITKIKEIGVAGTFTIGGIFFTNTMPAYSAGDYKRSFDTIDKFGTICLPYSAVCCGAQLYEITGKTASGVIVSEYEGVMEAGKAYLYKTLEAIKQDGGFKNEDNVYFFKAGYETVNAPIANNGLFGTFSDTKAPLNSYVLSSNKLYLVDKADAVTVGAYKAYVNLTAITPSLARGNVFIDFDEPTGIKTVKGSEEMSKESVFFDLQGRRVAQPVKGMYIVNGKKVMVK